MLPKIATEVTVFIAYEVSNLLSAIDSQFMKQLKLLFLPLLLTWGCAYDNTKVGEAKSMKLLSEEYFIYDANASSANGFVALYKKTYLYDQNKLTEVDAYDYNPNTHDYDAGYTYEEYNYADKGQLSQKVQFVGSSGSRWVEEYEYLNSTSTRVTRYESNTSGSKNSEDWWVIEKTPSSINVKYYQGNNELYAQLNYDLDSNGNVISVASDPSFPFGKIYYKHDNAPNPYKFTELSGEYGFDSEKYISENNVVEITNDSNIKSTLVVEYNDRGYPIAIKTPTSKRIFTYR